MQEYTFFWLDGTSELLKGASMADAANRAGYGAGAVKAIDFIAEGDKRNQYEWRGKPENSWYKKISE
jgi:hypothetical protein